MKSISRVMLAVTISAFLFHGVANSGVYKCKNENGETVYSQTKCAADADELSIEATPQKTQAARNIQARVEEIKYIAERRRAFLEKAANNRELKAYLDAIKLWDDTYQLGTTTPRMALSGVITKLAEQKNEIYFMPIEECYKSAKQILIKSMEAYIDSLTKFMINRNDIGNVTSTIYSDLGDDLRLQFWKAMPNSCSGEIPKE